MPSYRGQDGFITQGATNVGQIRSWSLDVTVELLDASVMGDDWKKHRGGMANWSGSMEALFDYGNPGQKAFVDQICVLAPAGNSIPVTLGVETGKTITGNVIIKGLKINDTLNDLVKMTIEFEGDGPPTLTWAAGA